MTEELKNRYCDFEDCRHKNAENICCLFNPNNCKFRKRIAELEATNKRISNECHTLVDTLEKKQEIINNTKAIDESFARLQEENAELREVIDNDVDKKIYVQLANKAKLADVQKVQLAKAKDFILKLTTYLEGHTNYDFEYELIKEVKQFLKDSEVEK